MYILTTIFPCLPLRPADRAIQLPTTETRQLTSEKQDSISSAQIDAAASRIVSTILTASKPTPNPSLTASIESHVHSAGGWSSYLAQRILSALEIVLKSGKERNAALQDAYDKAVEAANVFEGFVAEHPVVVGVFVTVVAVGVLVLLAPYAVEMLGFAEVGPVEGEFLFFLFFLFGEGRRWLVRVGGRECLGCQG